MLFIKLRRCVLPKPFYVVLFALDALFIRGVNGSHMV
jgi:hypothetical protein